MIRLRTLALALLALAAACSDDERDAVELTPTEPKPSVPEVPNDASTGEDVDSAVPATPIGADFDGGASDAAIDSPAEAPCPPVGTNPSTGARYAFAVPARLPKVLDGDLADFRRCVAIRLNASTAARVQGASNAIADIYLEWAPDALWIGADVADVAIDGSDPLRPFMNDSLEIYVSGAGLRTGDYGPLDHQIVVDHKGLARSYAAGREVGPFVDAVVALQPTGYRVEMRIPSTAFSTAPLAKGDVKFLDVMLNDGAGQPSFLVWAMQPHASCACATCMCNTSPAFDTLLFAPITLK